jgi:hypothetical protein
MKTANVNDYLLVPRQVLNEELIREYINYLNKAGKIHGALIEGGFAYSQAFDAGVHYAQRMAEERAKLDGKSQEEVISIYYTQQIELFFHE